MSKRKPAGYWQKWENVERELKSAISRNGGKFPSQRKFNEMQLSGIHYAIGKYHGGLNKARIRLGYSEGRKPTGYWRDKSNALAEARNVMDEHSFDELPSEDWLRKMGYKSLVYAIHKYHKGFHPFRKELGEKLARVKHGSWNDLGFTIREAKAIMKKIGVKELPSQEKLQESGYSGLCRAIQEYHGGFHKFRLLLGGKSKKLPNGAWKNLEFALDQASRFIQEHPEYDDEISQKRLFNSGKSSLAMAITKYHGGFPAFRRKLDEYMGRSSEQSNVESLLESYVNGGNGNE